MFEKYSKRSNELELMDLPFEKKEDLFENLKELEIINKLTGGPSLSFSAIKKILKNHTKEIHIVDIGFGAGDLLVYILKNQHQLNCKIKLTAIDLLPQAKEYALLHHPQLKDNVTFEVCDYRHWFNSGNKADLIIASLFCHHLNDEQLVEFFEHIKKNCSIGAVINDLARSPIAYYGIKIPTQLFSKSRFTKNDAPLSVLRGFRKQELITLLNKAQIKHYSLQWKWAYRYLLTINNNG
jgi:2-polyprenyl-3-methyl-5-hydroxy-6-metoxy-1,4-benzoquinol methylase